jgi:hypothetical protein
MSKNEYAISLGGDRVLMDKNVGPDHAECRERLSRAFGVTIERVVQVDWQPAIFQIHLAQGRIQFNGAARFTSQKVVRNEIADLTGRLIPRFKPDDWHSMAQDLLDAAEFDQLMTNPDVDPAAWFEEQERLHAQQPG